MEFGLDTHTSNWLSWIIQVAFARYQLPAIAIQPPILLAVSVAEKPKNIPLAKEASHSVERPPSQASVEIPPAMLSPFQQAAQRVETCDRGDSEESAPVEDRNMEEENNNGAQNPQKDTVLRQTQSEVEADFDEEEPPRGSANLGPTVQQDALSERLSHPGSTNEQDGEHFQVLNVPDEHP